MERNFGKELIAELRQTEDGADEAFSPRIPAMGPRLHRMVGAPPRPAAQKGAAFFEEVAATYRVISREPALRERAVAQACLLLVAAFGLPWHALAHGARALTQQRWPRPEDRDCMPDGPGLLLYTMPGVAGWQGVCVLETPDLMPPPPARTDAALLHPIERLAPVVLAPGLAGRLATLITSMPGAELRSEAAMTRLSWPDDALDGTVATQVLKRWMPHAPRLACQPQRIANAVGAAMRVSRVDPAVRGYVAGLDSRDVTTAAWYTAIPLAHLSSTLLSMQEALLRVLGDQLAPAHGLVPIDTRRLGSRRVPTARTTLSALLAMERHVRACMPTARAGLSGHVAYHNALVNRVGLLMHVVYGIRRTRNALDRVGRDTLDLGHFTIADKGIPYRELALIDIVATAIGDVATHARKLWEIAVVLGNHDVASAMDLSSSTGAGPSLMQIVDGADKPPVNARNWTPADLDAQLASLGVRVSTELWRHALRSDLLELGVDPSDIDAVTGHFQTGHGAWSPMSLGIPAEFLPRMRHLLETRIQWLFHDANR